MASDRADHSISSRTWSSLKPRGRKPLVTDVPLTDKPSLNPLDTTTAVQMNVAPYIMSRSKPSLDKGPTSQNSISTQTLNPESSRQSSCTSFDSLSCSSMTTCKTSRSSQSSCTTPFSAQSTTPFSAQSQDDSSFFSFSESPTPFQKDIARRLNISHIPVVPGQPPPKPPRAASLHTASLAPAPKEEPQDKPEENPYLTVPDYFFKTELVRSLNEYNFNKYLICRDAALVLFYSRKDSGLKKIRKAFGTAATTTNRPNHAYAAVNCGTEVRACDSNNITSTPTLAFFSNGIRIATLKHASKYDAETLRRYVEFSPSIKRGKSKQ